MRARGRHDISGRTAVAGVIGDPIAHSLSPAIHNAAFAACGIDAAFVAFPVRAGQAAGAVAGARALGLLGLSVTMPHKAAVVAAVDRCSQTAQRLGAVNTIVRVGGEMVGENTDGQGFLDAARHGCGFDPDGRRCVVVGAGGGARAVVLALAIAGAAEVVVVNRTRAAAEVAADLAGTAGRVGTRADVREADLVVQATPVGMVGTETAEMGGLIDADALGPRQTVVDLVYGSGETDLVAEARRRGATAVGGLGMLVNQAARAFTLWTGQDAPLEAMWAAARLAGGGEPR